MGGYAEGDIILHGIYAVGVMSVGCGVAMDSKVVVGGDGIVAVDCGVACGVAQELANLIGQDCRAKYGGLPDTVTIEGTAYTPVPPPAS